MQRLRRPEPCFSELTFDRACAGELSADAQGDLEQHLIGCVNCSLRYQVLSRQREEFLRKASDWEAFVQGSGQRARLRKLEVYYVVAAIAATAVLGLVATRVRHVPGEQQVQERTKGSSSIGFYVRRDAHVTRGASGDSVYPADELRFTYTSEHMQYFALLYADEHTASICHPLTGSTTRIEPGRDVPLDFGIALDGQLGAERAFGLFCDHTQELEPLRLQLQETGTLLAPAGCHVDVLMLQKRSR